MIFQLEIWLSLCLKVEFHFEIRVFWCREMAFQVEILGWEWMKVVFRFDIVVLG
jgi:hypothetical protein